jgi:hypothetical protein
MDVWFCRDNFEQLICTSFRLLTLSDRLHMLIPIRLLRAHMYQTGGSLSKAEAVEARRNEVYPTENKYSGLCNIWQRYAELSMHTKLTI